MAARHEIAEGLIMFDQWLLVKFFKGMFSDELGVEYRDESFFVSRQFVVPMQDGQAKMKVRIYQDAGTTWAVLPTENRATIAVEKKDLIAA